jgi:hypothetical protein
MIYREMVTWSEIAADEDNDLTTGSGARFVLREGNDNHSHHVLVLSDRLGTFQAFLAP